MCFSGFIFGDFLSLLFLASPLVPGIGGGVGAEWGGYGEGVCFMIVVFPGYLHLYFSAVIKANLRPCIYGENIINCIALAKRDIKIIIFLFLHEAYSIS